MFDTGQFSVRTHPDLFSTFSGHAQKYYSQFGIFDDIHSWDTTGFSLQSRAIDGEPRSKLLKVVLAGSN